LEIESVLFRAKLRGVREANIAEDNGGARSHIAWSKSKVNHCVRLRREENGNKGGRSHPSPLNREGSESAVSIQLINRIGTGK
jgi:hypothetical protein